MKRIHAFDLGIYNPFRMTNAEIKVNKATKEGIYFFSEDIISNENKPWEIRYDNSYPTVFYDSSVEKYRCYYSTFTTDNGSAPFTREERKARDYEPSVNRVVSLCYAESSDGVNWIKPNLGITEWNGSTKNNIIGHYLHGTSVLFDEQETDLSKKYKMFTKIDYGNGIHYMAVAFSEDGVHFDDLIELPDFNPRGDTYNSVIYDPYLSKYVLVTREWRDSMRVTCMSTSEDFIHWSAPEEILYPRGYENQIYSMPIFIEGDYRIGLASMFHEGDTNHEDFDKVDLELTYSYRYHHWNYVSPGDSFIERGEGNYNEGEFDNSCIFSARPIQKGNRTYFYYIGGNGQHTNFREGSLSRAYIENNRYAYIGQKDDENEAIVYTNAFTFLDQDAFLNADIEKDGYIEIELYHHDNSKIEDVKVALEKEDDSYRMIFHGDIGRTRARMQIKMKNAKIYSFDGNIELSRIENDNVLLRL